MSKDIYGMMRKVVDTVKGRIFHRAKGRLVGAGMGRVIDGLEG
jgi:hypothetical protein